MDPIDSVKWIVAKKLRPNDYNPNVVFEPELKLLEANIMAAGWVQPIIANTRFLIIDGFHRYMLATTSRPMLGKYGGLVPVVLLDIPDPEAMLLTIRMNRAKGKHVALKMGDVVRRLAHEHGYTTEQIRAGIGGTDIEVELLLHGDDFFKMRDLSKYRYRRAWVPMENGR